MISPTTIRGKYSWPEGWTDIDVFVDNMTGGGGSTADKQLKMMVDQYFDLSGVSEYNKYRPDGNVIGDLSKHGLASGEAYRFPLIRNTTTPPSTARPLPTMTTGLAASPPTPATSAPRTSTKCMRTLRSAAASASACRDLSWKAILRFGCGICGTRTAPIPIGSRSTSKP